MIDFVDGFIVLAFRNQVVYFDTTKRISHDQKQPETEIEISEDEVGSITIKDTKRVICLQEISMTQSVIIIEDVLTR